MLHRGGQTRLKSTSLDSGFFSQTFSQFYWNNNRFSSHKSIFSVVIVDFKTLYLNLMVIYWFARCLNTNIWHKWLVNKNWIGSLNTTNKWFVQFFIIFFSLSVHRNVPRCKLRINVAFKTRSKLVTESKISVMREGQTVKLGREFE